MTDFPNWPLVQIDWVDSSGGTSWNAVRDIKDEATVCRTVGFLAKSGENVVVVYASVATHSDNTLPQGHGEMTIPRVAIIKMREIR